MCIARFHMHQLLIWPKIVEKSGRKKPFIAPPCMEQTLPWWGGTKTYEPVVTFSINESDAITAVSNNLREETYKSFHITKEIEVIYNFLWM